MRSFTLVGIALLLAPACGDDDITVDLDSGDGSTTFNVVVENIGPGFSYPASGVFDTPVLESSPGPILVDGSYQFTFSAAPRYPGKMDTTRLSFATMLVASNDLFFAPDSNGIALFDASDVPIDGADVTAQVDVWDAGTEMNDGLAASQPPNVGAGTDENGTVEIASGFSTADYITVEIDSEETNRETIFTVTITNVGTGANATPVSPGVWVVHNNADTPEGPLFTEGVADRGEGLEEIAEDGMAGPLGTALAMETGLTVVSSPGVWALHTSDNPLFTSGMADRGDGLEAIAEDGDATALATALSSQTGVKSSNTLGTAPFGPGGMVSFSVTAVPGDRLSLATMVVPSNDYIFSLPGTLGVALFENDGTPKSGVISDMLNIWDVGTEVNQTPGVGLDQVHLQTAVDTGAADADNTVRLANDPAFEAGTSLLQVTVTPAS